VLVCTRGAEHFTVNFTNKKPLSLALRRRAKRPRRVEA
jgi:hypothetical protein